MIYDVRQTTTCAYASPVAHARHVLRLMPINRNDQRVHVAALQIVPEPRHRREGQDFFGNRLTWIEIEEPHRVLTVKLAARVSVEAAVEPAPLTTPPWEVIREQAFAARDVSPLSPAHFLFPSRMVSLDPEIRDYARASFPAGRAVLDAATELMNRLKSDIAYEIGATAWGVPVAVWPRGESGGKHLPAVARVDEAELARNGCRNLVGRDKRGWSLTEHGREWLEILTFTP